MECSNLTLDTQNVSHVSHLKLCHVFSVLAMFLDISLGITLFVWAPVPGDDDILYVLSMVFAITTSTREPRLDGNICGIIMSP